jgi:hypothetical protein
LEERREIGFIEFVGFLGFIGLMNQGRVEGYIPIVERNSKNTTNSKNTINKVGFEGGWQQSAEGT